MVVGNRTSQSPPAGNNAEDGQNTMGASPAVTARILKKRETDRKCQRMIRERTKSRIAYLEGIVEQFRQQDASGRVETLMKQLSDVKEERDSLAKQVKNIENIVTGIKLKDESDVHDGSSALVRYRSNESRTTNLSGIEHPYQSSSAHYEDIGASRSRDANTYAIYNKEFQNYVDARATWSSSPTPPTSVDNGCECSGHYMTANSGKVTNNWRYANDTLTEWFKWSPQTLDMTSFAPYNDDIPVRAIVEGWDAVEKRGKMHPIWRLLRGIDQTIFRTCEPRERLSILTVMGLLLQAHVNPTAEQHRKLPSFYLKRPSQDMLHSYATEYFAWPGLRERFIFSEHRYCSNNFWQIFCSSLRLQWPYEFRDCYVYNVDTGLYRISPTFHERVTDIRCWTMGMDMFKAYPELYGDIPAWNHIPASIVPYAHVSGMARRALPSTATVEQGSREQVTSHREREAESDMRPQHHQSQGQVQVQIPTSQPMYYDYPASATSTTFDTVQEPMPQFDFQTATMVTGTSIAGMQAIPPAHHWAYPSGLDMYPLNAT